MLIIVEKEIRIMLVKVDTRDESIKSENRIVLLAESDEIT